MAGCHASWDLDSGIAGIAGESSDLSPCSQILFYLIDLRDAPVKI
jgi:hypothetical protein